MDEGLRKLDRAAQAGDREAALKLRRARERCSPAGQLLRLLNVLANRIGRFDRQMDRVERFNKANPSRTVSLPWRHSHNHNPFTIEEALKRTWRKYYRAWLRETGKRAVIDGWLTTPSPKCTDPQHEEEHNRALRPCVERRTIILLPDTRHTWLHNIEWSENSDLITRARKRATVMQDLADKKGPRP